MDEQKLHVDLTPIASFRYSEISNYQFQFLLLGKNNQALHTPVQCKDYFQDIFFTEATGVPADVYGLEWRKGMVDTDVEYFRMALNGGSLELESHIPAFQTFLNAFDSALGFRPSVVLPTDNPKIIVVDFSKEWTTGGPLLSAYTTLIRLAQLYSGEDVMEYLKKIHEYKDINKRPKDFPQYMGKEISRLDRTITKLAALLQGKKPESVWEDFKNSTNIVRDVHDLGVVNYPQFPTVSVE